MHNGLGLTDHVTTGFERMWDRPFAADSPQDGGQFRANARRENAVPNHFEYGAYRFSIRKPSRMRSATSRDPISADPNSSPARSCSACQVALRVRLGVRSWRRRRRVVSI